MRATHELTAAIVPRAMSVVPARAFDSRVRLLSNTGISLWLAREVDLALRGHDALTVSLQLPGRPSPCEVACLVRHRVVADDEHVLYSCEFDWSATLDALAVVEDLLEYTLDAR